MNTRKNSLTICLLLVTGMILISSHVEASIEPASLSAILSPGEMIAEDKCVTIEELPPRADVIFAFDLTGSMGDILSTAKASTGTIISTLSGLGVDVQFGVMSYMDYNGDYESCGYSASYGGGPDYPYNLDQPITDDTTAVVTAINDLELGWGNDGPQDYTRIFYESYADPSVGWRTGAKRILVNFGDNVPHDCDLTEGVPGVMGGPWSTGADPGPDGIILNGDDLDLQTVLAEMDDNGVTLIECHTSDWDTGYGPILDFWDYWTGLTGGGVYLTDSATLVDDVVDAITSTLETPIVYGLHLEASPGFESWIVDVVPSSYPELEPGDSACFELIIGVPAGTPDDIYPFIISALDEDGVSYGDQEVEITVVSIIEVEIDVKPGSYPSSVNLKSKGVTPVAILTTDTFDATTVDPESVRLICCTNFAEAFAVKGKIYDCDHDGDLDLVVYFDTPELKDTGVLVPGQMFVCLDGETYDGIYIYGEGDVRIVEQGKP